MFEIRLIDDSHNLDEVRLLWSSGLLRNIEEFNYPPELAIEERGFVDSCLAQGGDMHDLPTYWMKEDKATKGAFWVASCSSSNEIIGCIGLRPTISDTSIGDIGRYTVAPGWRGKGVGKALLVELESFANSTCNYQYVTATTVSLNYAALKNYAAYGYEEVYRGRQDGKIDQPAFCRMRKTFS